MEDYTYINEPIDLGTFKMVLKDHFQLHLSGWIEPFDNEEDPKVPFDFGEGTEEAYKADLYITLHPMSKPLIQFSSEDEEGINGEPSILLTTGTDPDDDPSSLSVSAPFQDTKEFKYLREFYISIIITNPEGLVFTEATAKIINDWRNYS